MTSPKNKTNQRLKTFTFPSLASLTLVACSGGGGGGELVKLLPPAKKAPVAMDYQNTLMMDEDGPVSLAQQPLEPSMVKMYSITDLPFLDNCNTMLDDTILIVISELG